MPNVFNVSKRALLDGTIFQGPDNYEVLLFATSPQTDLGGGQYLSGSQLDLTTVAAVEADAGFAEATHASYTGAAGSTSGRMVLGSRTPSTDNTNDRAEMDAPDITWAAQNGYTIQGALVYKRVGAAGPSGDGSHIPVAYFKLGPVTTNGGDIVLQWNVEGLFHVT